MDLQQYLSVALECAGSISEVFKQGFYELNQIDWKSEKDPVTEYDKKIEQLSRKFLSSRFPTHVILGEEDGLSSDQKSDFKWIIDPIDGTINYTRGISFVSYSLALSYKGEIIVAVVSNPILDEVFYAMKDQGAYFNGMRIEVNQNSNLSQSYLAMGTYKEKYANIYHSLIKTFQCVRNPGSAALALAYVAAGRMDGLVYFNLSPWDMAAGILLVTEAGGKINNIDSPVFDLDKMSIIASSASIHDKLNHIVSIL